MQPNYLDQFDSSRHLNIEGSWLSGGLEECELKKVKEKGSPWPEIPPQIIGLLRLREPWKLLPPEES